MTGDDTPVVVDTLIVGLGLSAIPLLVELQKSGREFAILSSGRSVWQRLGAEERLDFDLVSSKHSSVYAEEQIEDGDPTDVYPTSSQFASFIERWRRRFADHVIDDRVVRVVHRDGSSVVHTASGATYHATHLVFATAFKRKIHGELEAFDFDAAAGKTVVVDGAGDSANLIMAKLVPRGCRVILRTNGFTALDKAFYHRDATYTLDQFEFHNLARLSPGLYRSLIMGWALPAFVLPAGPRRALFGSIFEAAHPTSRRLPVPGQPRRTRNRRFRGAMPNGNIAIKYWPVDTYERMFGDDLEANIERGYLLNDLPLFIDSGLVELWPKHASVVDEEAGEIRMGDERVAFDHVISGDREAPNLPEIVYADASGDEQTYEYVYRNTFLGVIPREMKNVYLLGYTRPTTGGLANIIEMQSLLVHRVIEDEALHARVFDDLEAHIREYDDRFYAFEENGPTDHLVWYGHYTEELAKWIGIRPRLRDCRSPREVLQYFFYPNGALKYRQRGRYALPGARELVNRIWDGHSGFAYVQNLFWSYLLIQLLALVLVALLPLPIWGAALLGVAAVFVHHPFACVWAHHVLSWQPWVNLLSVAGAGVAIATQSPAAAASTFFGVYALAFVGRLLGKTRLTFNDLKVRRRPRYRAFLERYETAFRRVVARRRGERTDDLQATG